MHGSLGLVEQPTRASVEHWLDGVKRLLHGRKEPVAFWHSQDLLRADEAFDEVFDASGLPAAKLADEDFCKGYGGDKQYILQMLADAMLMLDGRLLDMPGRPSGHEAFEPRRMLKALSSRSVAVNPTPQTLSELAAFAQRNRVELLRTLRTEFDDRVQLDLQEFRKLADEYPHLSTEELRHLCRDNHRSRSYVSHHVKPALGLERAVDRSGDEPNLLLAIAAANAMVRAPVGTTLQEAARMVREESPWVERAWPGFDGEALAALSRCYEAIPKWPMSALTREVRKSVDSPTVEDVPEHIMSAFRELSLIPGSSPLLEAQANLRQQPPALAGHRLVSVELAANDVVGYLDHLIRRMGASGPETTIIWKPYSDDQDDPSDRLIPRLCERMFGIRGLSPGVDDDLAKVTEEAIHEAAAHDDPLAIHVLGVQDWSGIGRLHHANPARPIKVIAHTSSDHDAFLKADLGELTVVNMADAPAKHLYERLMLGEAIAGALLQLEQTLNVNVRHRDFLIHGMGRTVGPAILIALDRMGVPRDRIHVTDPALGDEGFTRLGLRRAVDVPALFERALVSLNATPGHVLTDAMLDRASTDHPVIHIQLGSNRKDVQLAEARSAKEYVAPIGRQRITRHRLPRPASKEACIYFPGDGKVLNHAFRRPIPTERTDFINLLKAEAWLTAARCEAEGLRGPQPLTSISVAFDEAERGRQPIAILHDVAHEPAPVDLEALRLAARHIDRAAPIALVDMSS